MKFAIINDIHIGPIDTGYFKGVQRKVMSEAKRLVNEFVKILNTKEHPEFVVNLGDFIEDVNNKETDIQSFKKAIKLLSPLKMPVYSLIGNHDIRTLTETEIAEMLGMEKMYYSFDYESYHFIALSFEMTGDHTKNKEDITAKIPQKEIDWLINDLSKTNKPVIVFIHYGLADDDMNGNFWFEKNSKYALLENRAKLRKIFEDSKKVKAVISGHQHWNRMHVHNEIPYFVVTSPVENFNNDGIPSEAYTIVELDNKKIKVKVKGKDPTLFEFTFPHPIKF